MRCIERWSVVALGAAALGAVAVTAGCGSMPWSSQPAPAAPPSSVTTLPQARLKSEAPANVAGLPPAATVHSWAEVRLQAAHRLVAANPKGTYTGVVEEPLLAVPVLEIELNADGSVRHIGVLREPQENKDTIEVAVQAVRRAAPFGDVSRLPKPWRFTETFLFNDERKFKPRTLDQ